MYLNPFRVGTRLLVFIFYLLIPFAVLSQEGDFYVSNFIIEPDRVDNPYFSISQGDDGLIYVSNRSGILQYDGNTWKRIPCPGAVYSMLATEGKFFVGGKFGFGVVKPEPKEGMKFTLLSDSLPNSVNIFRVESRNEFIYFMNSKSIFIISTEDMTKRQRLDADSLGFAQLIKYDDELYVIYEDGSLAEISGNAIVNAETPFPNQSIPVFIQSSNTGKTLLGTLDDEVFISYSGSFYKVNIEDEEYFRENSITDGIWLNDTLVAIGTLKGGVAFIDPANGKLKQIINTHTGLNDNEVMGLQLDLDNGLWVAQSNGLNRVAPYLPVSTYSNYPGLSGKLISLYPFKDQLYVSTSLGVYTLKEVKDYKEIVSFIKKKVEVEVALPEPEAEVKEQRTRRSQRKEAAAEEIPQEEPEKPKRRLFSFLRKNKKVEDSTAVDSPVTSPPKIALAKKQKPSTRDSLVTEKKVYRELQSIRNLYQRIEGIDSRCTLYAEVDDELIVAGLAGIFLLSGDSATVISKEAVRDIFITSDKLMVASTVSGKIQYYGNEEGLWQLLDELVDLEDRPLHIYEDTNNSLWLTGTDEVYKLVKTDTEISIENFSLENPFSDRTLATEAGSKIVFINPNGVYSIGLNGEEIEQDTLIQNFIGMPRKYFESGDYIWINNGSNWYRMGIQPGEKSKQIVNLSLISDLKFVAYDESLDAFWVINGSNEIYKINQLSSNLLTRYRLFLKDFNNLAIEEASEKVFELLENSGPINFEYVHPDYSGVMGIQYRYKLDGLDGQWSTWSQNSDIRFPYLPEGKYSIIVQSKDIFGQFNESTPIQFRIIPPVWQRPWFYALEILFFASLFVLSIKLNRSRSRRFLILNRLLAFLTLLLMVELIQAIAEAKFEAESSPIFNFFIQVGVAAAILPAEHFLRRWLIGETRLIKKTVDLSEEPTPSD